MECPACGTVYEQGGSPDDGYVRSICECEAKNKCFKCKRGQHQPVNQALLDLDGEVRHYACAKHGHLDAEGFAVPASASSTKPKPALATKVEPEAPTTPRTPKAPKAVPVEPPNPLIVRAEWPAIKQFIIDDLKGPRSRYFVTCLGCKKKHLYSTRKLVLNDETMHVQVLCPHCGDGSYRIE